MATVSAVYTNGTSSIEITFVTWQKSVDYNTAAVTVGWQLQFGNATGNYITTQVTAKINNEAVYDTYNTWANGTIISGSYIYQMPLNGGSKSVPFSINAKAVSGDVYDSDTIPLSINTHAMFNSFPDYYDTENFDMEYTCNGTSSIVQSIQLEADFLETRYLSINSTSSVTEIEPYTIVFTDEERAAMRATFDSLPSINYATPYGTAIFYLRTIFTDGSYQRDRTDVRVYIAKNPPTFNPTIVDTSATAIALTGDKNTLVRHISNAHVTINPVTSYGSTLASYGVTHGSSSYEGQNEVDIRPVESDTFYFYATDSIGMTGTQTVTVPFVDYVKLTCNLKKGAITGVGTYDISVNGKFFNDSFGKTTNELFVYYRYKLKDGEYSDWVRITNVSYDSNAMSYVATATISGLDYNSSYTFQAYAADIIDTVHSAERDVISLPVFDWSATDFNFNVPVTIQDKALGANRILWEGNDVVLANANLELAEPISEQFSGIVLIFSGSSGDVSWSTHYVPKELVKFYNGGGHTFLMAVNAGLSTFGAKYLYITDDMITGHTTNGQIGSSASGIMFANSSYVLRYVIGV